ncbi:serpin B4-like [Choloepus didactylus]|uniref:serpin B4-like n=1 Tax=Choloepus didactylus TaxID=27675 RepID=UPI0018A02F41|nr:serpin B4-like [Choloepus didactylus]
MNSLSGAITQFGLDLFQELRKSEKGNIFLSPLNIASALSMLLLGARNNTALQIEKVLHLKEVTENTKADSTGNVHDQFHKLLTELKKSTGDYQLNIANGLYGEKTFQFLQEYVDNNKKFYLASVESVDFVNAAEESEKKINSWVESQTNGKIKDLFPKGSLDSSTILVLLNAVYFKGQWAEAFKKEYTEEGEFWVNKNESKPVQMMKQSALFNLAFLKDEKAKILEIPYKGKDLSMFVLLPDEVDGLQKLEDKLTAEKLIKWMSSANMRKRNVDLYLPRFKLEESYKLHTQLGDMGMQDAFSNHADFSGMTGGRGLKVSKILHKSFVDVNEEGTEAAAATGTQIVVTSAPIYEKFHCDHPFLFVIMEKDTESILFLGAVSSP